MNKLTLLGTGTNKIEVDRMASSVLLELGKTTIVYDIGRGVTQRLAQLGRRLNDIEHIITSHFHADHISDLVPYLHSAVYVGDKRNKPLNIYGPEGVDEMVNKVIDMLGYLDLEPRPFEFDITVHEFHSGEFLKIDDQEFEPVALPPVNNHGIRFEVNGKTVCLTGDSNFHQEEIEFLKNCDIAIIDSGHITDDEIVELIKQSRPGATYLSHVNRELDAGSFRKLTGENVVLGRDLMEIDLD
ncbi:MBL fold metallo-hydrolase [Candidatus Dojkabacteria bacterium]|nr:MBL fold metallo-hydrolase [Candidatus Dojkabacteria bacterium]